MIAFGPIPSRRLGKSVGINNIPPKNCTYSCIYCQVGRNVAVQAERSEYYRPEDIFADVQDLVMKVKQNREHIDYFTFVTDGEPTLDINLGKEIDLIRLLDHRTAVLTNGTLLADQNVRDDLMKADYVSIKVDTTDTSIWQKINQPHKTLRLDAILQGVVDFSTDYQGILVTETMLVDGINTSRRNLISVSDFVTDLEPDRAYIAVPTRPTAAKSLKLPDEATLNKAFQIFKKNMQQVEYLIGYEGSDVGYSGNVVNDILRISAVHPLRTESIQEILDKAHTGWKVVENLISEQALVEVEYAGSKFYVRRFAKNHASK